MKSQVTVRTSGAAVEFRIADANGASAAIPLSRRETFGVVALLLKALEDLPPDTEAPLHLQKPGLTIKDPTCAVGVVDGELLALAMKTPHIPTIEFHISKMAAGQLSKALAKAASLPASTPSRN